MISNNYIALGWWALGWIEVYDLVEDPKYLEAAVKIFHDMVSTGYNASCGGIWWNRDRQHNVAISNELFLSVAAHLANRVPNKDWYIRWAQSHWEWFQGTGLINKHNNINDGLDLRTCLNNHDVVWTYNQGVILGALVELNKAVPNDSYLKAAKDIASAAIVKLSDDDRILREPFEPHLGNDGPQFKGIFMRNLQTLQIATKDPVYKRFLEVNADSIWLTRDTARDLIGPVWSGSSERATASTQSSALDALVGAAAVQ